jgi:hypothetical protein
LFWENFEALVNCTADNEVVKIIHGIVGGNATGIMPEDISPIGTTSVSLGVGAAKPGRTSIVCGTQTAVDTDSRTLYLTVPTKHAKTLVILTQDIFPATIAFALEHGILNSSSISIVATDPSKETIDMSVAITLILLCLFFDDKGTPHPYRTNTGHPCDRRNTTMTKDMIRTRLVWIITARGQQAERVSRNTLKIVNTYLMSPLHRPHVK